MINTITNLEQKIKRLFGTKSKCKCIIRSDNELDAYYFDELLSEGYIQEYKDGLYIQSLKARRLRPSSTTEFKLKQKYKGLL